MVRSVVIPEDAHIELDIPADYIGKEVEVIYSLLGEATTTNRKKTMADFLGILSDKSAKELHDHVKKTRKEWDRIRLTKFLKLRKSWVRRAN
jgi:predicted regulator of amino acid metabolism with ACT domain